MKIIRRTSPAFRAIQHPAPTRSGLTSYWPSKRAISAAYHYLLGTDNPNDLCKITGKRLHPNLRGYHSDGGAAYTKAPAVAFPNGAVGNVVLSGSGVPSTTKVSGGAGYTSTPVVTVAATLAPGGWLPRYKAITAAGTVSALAILDPGFGLLDDPVLTFSGGGGAGANFTASLYRSVRRIDVTNGGGGFTGAPTVTVSGGGPATNARAIPIVAGGVVTSILLLDGGERFTSVPNVTIAGGGGAGATAVAVLGTNCVRYVEILDCGSQVGSIAGVLTGGDGAGAVVGALMTGAVYTRSANSLTIPAGGTTDSNAQNGLLLPMLDTGEFTVIVAVKKMTSGLAQVVVGTATEGGSAAAGFDIKNVIGVGYRLTDFNVQLVTTTLASPGVEGAWIHLIYSVTPVAGASLKPSASFVQSSRLYARAGLQPALSVASGQRLPLSKRRLIGIGNTQQIGVGFRGALEVAEIIVYQRALSVVDIEAEIAGSVIRMGQRGINVIT